MTMTRTLSSSVAESSSASSASITATDKALAGGLSSVSRRIGPCRSTPTIALDRVERVGEVGDEIVGILDPDRDPHQIIGDPERLLALVGDRQMGHRGRRAGQGLGAAEADCKMGDAQRIEKCERLLLAALQIEREG